MRGRTLRTLPTSDKQKTRPVARRRDERTAREHHDRQWIDSRAVKKNEVCDGITACGFAENRVSSDSAPSNSACSFISRTGARLSVIYEDQSNGRPFDRSEMDSRLLSALRVPSNVEGDARSTIE